jgi:hypothetical protein
MQKILIGETQPKGTLGKSMSKLKDNIKMYLKEIRREDED